MMSWGTAGRSAVRFAVVPWPASGGGVLPSAPLVPCPFSSPGPGPALATVGALTSSGVEWRCPAARPVARGGGARPAAEAQVEAEPQGEARCGRGEGVPDPEGGAPRRAQAVGGDAGGGVDPGAQPPVGQRVAADLRAGGQLEPPIAEGA